MRLSKITSLAVFTILIAYQNHAQIADRFYNITRRDGLASGSITAIVQDQKGLMWLGTKKGLNRYDGSNFVHLHTGNSELSSNDISTLLIDQNLRLWIGTFGGGIHYLDLRTNSIKKIDDPGIGNRIFESALSQDSVLWILSDRGLYSQKSSVSTLAKINERLKNNGSSLSIIDSKIWIGTQYGQLLTLNNDGSYETYNLITSEKNIYVHKIHPLTPNSLLIGTRQHGLLKFHIETESVERVDIEAVDIRDIITDQNGIVWVGTDGNGVYRISKAITKYEHHTTRVNSLASNAVQVCFEDRGNNLWFGTAWDGISFLDHRMEDVQFYYSDYKGVDQSGVLSIYKEADQLWFGTDGSGLSINNRSPREDYFSNNIAKDTYVQFIKKIKNDYWVGTFQSGFYIFSDEKISHYTSKEGLIHDDVRHILELGNSEYLIGTWGGGLTVFNRKTEQFRNLNLDGGNPKDVVTLYQINSGGILVGTFGQGVFLLDVKSFKMKRILEDLHNVVSINETRDGVWLGTWGQGLHLSKKSFTESSIVMSKQLDNQANVVSILSFDDNRIWAATTEKVLQISDSNQITEMPFPHQQYHLNACFKSGDKLYFGGTDGVISFNPKKTSLSTPKSVEILQVKILDKNAAAYHSGIDELFFEHDENIITFNYTTPTFPVSRGHNYEIKLSPTQKDWVNVGAQQVMTFADLKPGNYKFRVRNVTSENERLFEFNIRRPWWKTWWAYSIASLLFLALLYSFRKYSVNLERVRNQLEIEKIGREKDVEISEIKQRFFVNISHEIRTPLTLILGEIEQLAHKAGSSKTVATSLKNLRNNGNYLLQLVNELLDFRRIDQDGIKLKVAEGNFVSFCREIYLSFLNKSEAQAIKYVFVSEHSKIDLWYDRDQLEKVFFNLLSNAFKNTPEGGTINFVLKETDTEVLAIIEDTGHGISKVNLKEVFQRFYQKENDPNAMEIGYGIGLSIVQEITHLHRGEVSVESEQSKGSRFTIQLKKGKEHFDEKEFIDEFQNSDALEAYQRSSDIEDSIKGNIEFTTKILVVEDNPEIREFLVKMLSRNFKVMEASDGEDAYQIISEELPDLIVSDVMMPGMDGITLTRNLKQNQITSHIPIILLTARTSTVFKKEGFETGADDYITKPFSLSLLITRINNILMARENLRKYVRNELAVRPQDLNLTSPDEKFLKEMTKVVQSNLDNSELNAELVANEMGMSHSVVYKKIKALTGLSLVEFVRDYRLQQAGQMLRKFGFSVAETCYKVGFSDKKYFSQIFKKKYGITPSEYASKDS